MSMMIYEYYFLIFTARVGQRTIKKTGFLDWNCVGASMVVATRGAGVVLLLLLLELLWL